MTLIAPPSSAPYEARSDSGVQASWLNGYPKPSGMTPITVAGVFPNFTTDPIAGVHFVVFNPSGDDFERNRLAMDGVLPDGTKLEVNARSRAQGFNSVLTTTHRQNFLVPPRLHRSFPLAEL